MLTPKGIDMQTKKDSDGIRTEATMRAITKILDLPVPVYNRIYEAVYEEMRQLTIKNLQKCLREIR